jgi:hypothetical protein
MEKNQKPGVGQLLTIWLLATVQFAIVGQVFLAPQV